MQNRCGTPALIRDSFRYRLRIALALAGSVSVVGTAVAVAAPAAVATPAAATPITDATRGLPQVVNDVLGPADPAFWNPAVPGTRVLTPVDPHDDVICLTGFVPVINCWTKEREGLTATMRPLAHIDVLVGSGAPMRIWVDLPRWGDGSTGEGSIRQLSNDVVVWWLTGRAPGDCSKIAPGRYSPDRARSSTIASTASEICAPVESKTSADCPMGSRTSNSTPSTLLRRLCRSASVASG